MDLENLDPTQLDVITVPDAVYEQQPIIYDIKNEVIGAFQDFYISHVEGSLRIFHTLTMGEIVIAVLLGLLIVLFIFRWIWEVVRYG